MKTSVQTTEKIGCFTLKDRMFYLKRSDLLHTPHRGFQSGHKTFEKKHPFQDSIRQNKDSEKRNKERIQPFFNPLPRFGFREDS